MEVEVRKKRSIYIIIAGILVLGLLGCGGKKESENMVIVYSPHGMDILTQFEKLFEEK